jgi:hypothetical protein
MKPHLRYYDGLWWCGPVKDWDYFLWACCAPTVREVCSLWSRCLPMNNRAAAVSAATT